MIDVTGKSDAYKKKLAYIIEDIPTAIAVGINSTAKKARLEVAKAVKKELGRDVPLKAIKSTVQIKAVATRNSRMAVMKLAKGKRISLRYFKARKAKGGVTVQLNRHIKGKAGRKFLPKAFIAARLGGKVFERRTHGKGSKRLPIDEQMGPRPGEFMEALGVQEMTIALIRKELPKRIKRRIRFLLLKKSGGLRGNQPTL